MSYEKTRKVSGSKKLVIAVTLGAFSVTGLGLATVPALAETSATTTYNVTNGPLTASATVSGANGAVVKWSDSTTGLKGFKVERDGKDANGTGAWGTTVSPSTKTFEFTKLLTGSVYNLKVTEVLSNGSLGKSVTVVFKTGSGQVTPAPTTPAPVALKGSVVANGADGARVSWVDSTTGLKGYKVARDGKDANGTGAWGTTVSATTKTFDFTKLLSNNTYNFTVTQVLANGTDGLKTTVSYKVGSGSVTPPPTTQPPTTQPPTTPPPTTPAPSGPYASGHPWMSGAAGVGVADGSFGNWRGSKVDIISTWSDNDTAAANFWQFQSGGEFGKWNGPVDIAVGAFDNGGSWAAGANGSYDAKWRQSLTKLKSLRQGKGTTYIRFAHEQNGNWYPWKVTSGNSQDFIKAWKRYRAIQKEVFPEAKLVFNVNRESVNNGIDWRKTVPGYAEGNVKSYVDVMGVDYYNQYPYTSNASEFASASLQTDGYGAPKGIERHRQFAQSVGLPLSISEWSGNADNGDNASFMTEMKNFDQKNAGTGAGNLLYEVIFNVDKDNKRWLVYGSGVRMPAGATSYKNAF